LTAAFKILWTIVNKNMKDTAAKLLACEAKHDEQHARVEQLGIKFAVLEGRMLERNEPVGKTGTPRPRY
jgi:hypothetical protein